MTSPTIFLSHLPGTWHLERKISHTDHRESFFRGLAHIRPTDVRGTYSYHEEGSFVQEQTAHEAYRDYLYKVRDKTLDIIFADPHRAGTLYVSLDFSGGVTAQAQHLCGNDTYQHQHEIISAHEFVTDTIVSGPEKDYRLQSTYRRF